MDRAIGALARKRGGLAFRWCRVREGQARLAWKVKGNAGGAGKGNVLRRAPQRLQRRSFGQRPTAAAAATTAAGGWQGDVRTRCLAADPKYGERWCAVSKDPAHRKLPRDRVLELAAAGFEVP